MHLISIHAPPRGATPRPGKASGMHLISIHAPPRGATALGSALGKPPTYFNSRPSARGDNAAGRAGRQRPISIHAPPRGATRRFCRRPGLLVFQFTPLREGRRHGAQAPRPRRRFQFTPLREGRPRARRVLAADDGISIHAPPRGATLKGWCIMSYTNNFNSRPSARGDLGMDTRYHPRQPYFNSRPSARGDRTGKVKATAYISFQFTPLREGRPTSTGKRSTISLFQFTPLREGRHADAVRGRESRHYFNSRPSARGDIPSMNAIWRGFLFQFTPLREGRRCMAFAGGTGISFQFTPLREGRQARHKPSSRRKQFQFTPLREGRR